MSLPSSSTIRAAVLDQRRPRRGGRRADLELRELPHPEPPAPGWVVLRPSLSGICGADVDLLRAGSPRGLMQDEDIVPGHEMVGIVSVTRGTRWVREGQRVLVEPTLRCAHKGLPDCRRCRVGEGHLCENVDRAGVLCSGRSIGFSTRTGGGWSEALLVHEEMLLPAEGISDQRAVLAEPAAAALHAVMRWQRRGSYAVVIGGGTLSRLVVATLARLHPDLDISLIYDGREAPRQRWGKRRRAVPGHFRPNSAGDVAAIREMGAARVWRGAPLSLLEQAAELTSARLLRRDQGLPVLDRGVDVVFDCRGTSASVQVGLHLLRSGGSLVLLHPPSRLDIDWTMLWSREISLHGASTYGRETNGWRSFAVAREWLSDSVFPVDGMVTHRYPLEEVNTAVATAAAGAAVGALKVVIEATGSHLRGRVANQKAGESDHDEPIFVTQAAHRLRR